ncbi:MAG: AAA family ATPase [Lachnospiraceae bacterium]|nr:AAA family ATPase [Lachnospiraceae bacterium]
MAKFMTTKEASEKWGVSERRINTFCKEGRIPGAYKDKENKNKQWMIPADAVKPADKRLKRDASISLSEKKVASKSGKKLPLPIGISDYRKASSEYYYVDKTLLIRDFIDERPQVSLFTRPRRFGKTLNMDMIRVFFERSEEDTSAYFRDKKIWECGKEYQKYQGKYPIIYVTFKDVKCEDWEMAYDLIYKILRNEFERHSELLASDKISAYDKQYLTSVLRGEANENDVACAFLNLSRLLHIHYGVAPMIIIDEYDTPIQQGHVRGYYDKVINFMRTLFSGGLKDNPHLSYGFLTGILRVAKESIFSGLNNIKVNSVLDNRYSEYFGFTSEEVQEMAEYYGAPEKYDELCEWYDGYRFGKTEIFNPWSVIGYFNNECIPRAFWQSTGSNDIISEVLGNATIETYEKLESLMQGKSFVTHIDTGVIYPQLQNNPSSIYSFLLVTGYLKAVTNDQPFGGDYMCEVALPNKEISYVYSKEILYKYENVIPPAAATAIQEAIYTMDIPKLQNKLETFLLQTISFHDAANETFYHGLILGLLAILDNQYHITSNREAGNGRFDIQMLPLNKKLPGILIELKAGKDCTEGQLNELAETALTQINDRQYDVEMSAQGVKDILKYGIAFSGKSASIRAEVRNF